MDHSRLPLTVPDRAVISPTSALGSTTNRCILLHPLRACLRRGGGRPTSWTWPGGRALPIIPG